MIWQEWWAGNGAGPGMALKAAELGQYQEWQLPNQLLRQHELFNITIIMVITIILRKGG